MKLIVYLKGDGRVYNSLEEIRICKLWEKYAPNYFLRMHYNLLINDYPSIYDKDYYCIVQQLICESIFNGEEF